MSACVCVWLHGMIGIIGLGCPCGLNEFPFSSPLLPRSTLISLMSEWANVTLVETASKSVSYVFLSGCFGSD